MEPAKIHAHDDIGFDTPGAGASVTDDDDDVVDVIVVAFQVGVWLIILAFFMIEFWKQHRNRVLIVSFPLIK